MSKKDAFLKKRQDEDDDTDVSQISQEAFLEALNVDLAAEYAAVILYRSYASQIQGQWRMELRQFFESEIPDELGHAQILADKIVSLGGIPTTVPARVKTAKDAKEMLRNALEDEIETIGRYVLRRKQAEALGHYGLAVEFDDLIRDESTHRDEIQLILKRWDTG
ncbi:MAG TPA: ferritin-like domain-containing protein [Thermoanaerobaculia bacterium]|jgi:bacterioferritin|nr:ferritin-like domain-containing protein [Thermoanaerobaculia bacterium]